ncbi:DUF7220 family protein [Neptunomonas japonica]|uniref:Uncharacterized protein n=1 Tax=Neptunomonas japonica JAMM 1380 TaxID=1441457 RepID=A0A7R6P8U7_9GAMM|nr:hypothetical protein [Neptunomonas japonica]BBB29359.1 conserved hypothetical protein [Neptunomonas japonica JAMM 1380]
MQSRIGSAVEAIQNIIVGYTVNMLANFVIFPFFGWDLSLQQNLALGVIYTAISFVRSYAIRRFNNWNLMQ